MKKRIIFLLMVFCLAAFASVSGCGKIPDDSSEGKTILKVPAGTPDKETDPAVSSADTSGHSSNHALGGTYWTAVKHEYYDYTYGRTEMSQMPTEKWWADLFLNEDGTAQFREVVGDSYNCHLGNGTWWLGVDDSLRLTSADGDGIGEMNGRIENDSIILETFYGERFYLKKAQPPGPGGELCIADLYGSWQMTKVEMEGVQYDARERGMASTLYFETRWSEYDDNEYVLMGDCYFAEFLDTNWPEYRQAFDLQAEFVDKPLIQGLSNEIWSVRLSDPNTGSEFYLTLTDPSTLYVQEHYGPGGSQTVRTAIYERTESFIPEILQTILYEEPADCLTFYWPNPPDEVSVPLEAMPVTELEPDGLDRLLLVGCWYETQICFYTGEAVWDDNGILLDWITEEVLYDETIGINDIRWFSLTIPEGEPNLCLYIKRPWEEYGYYWPLTDTGGYLVNGWMFLTP